MARDLRPRRSHNRPASGRFAFSEKPARLAGCFGGLSPAPGFTFGSAIGQISEPQIASTNLQAGTANPFIIFGTTGTAATAADAANQWDAGFIPLRGTSNNGLVDFVFSGSPPQAAALTQYTISAQVSVDPNLALPNPSTSVRIAVNWQGGVAREDSITINPLTGQIQAVSAGVTNISVNLFPSVANSKKIQVVSISFTAPITPAGTTNAIFRVYPNAVAGVGVVDCGGFQIEQGAIATSFISTSNTANQTRSRPLGTLPRTVIDHSIPIQIITTNYTYNPGFDNGALLTIQTNGITLTLGSTAIPGEYCDVYFQQTTFFTATAATSIRGAGLPQAGVVSCTFPYDGVTPAGGVGPFNVCGVRFTHVGLGNWQASSLAESHGTARFTANGTFVAGDGLTTIWIDGTGGGGGGGGAVAINSAAGGGNGGSCVKDNILTTVPGTSYTVTIGTGGNGGAAGNNNGVAGTSTIIGALLTITGGDFGQGGAVAAITGANSAPTAGGGRGGISSFIAASANYGGTGGGSIFASSTPAQVAVNPNGSGNGFPGALYGAGGGGGTSGTNGGAAASGGNGANGFASIRW